MRDDERFGKYGVWVRTDIEPDEAAAIEETGFTSLWVGGSPPDDLTHIERLLEATRSLVIVTGVVNMWSSDPETLATSHHRVSQRFPGRFVLGISVGHRERDGYRAVAPLGAIEEFLDGLDAHGVPKNDRLLAALGPRMLRLAGERSLGAHPYMTTPAHTSHARELMGPQGFLAPEQRLVITSDHESGLERARSNIGRYLRIANYQNNLLSLGYQPSDLENDGSDRLIRDLAAIGDAASVTTRLDEHHGAGADHVAIQIYAEPATNRIHDLKALAAHLTLP